ncbi:MAG: hypothetical protein ACRCUP_06200 [Mycoplasmatales bacterium]
MGSFRIKNNNFKFEPGYDWVKPFASVNMLMFWVIESLMVITLVLFIRNKEKYQQMYKYICFTAIGLFTLSIISERIGILIYNSETFSIPYFELGYYVIVVINVYLLFSDKKITNQIFSDK